MGKLKKLKYNFDKVTSKNSTDWQLAIFWIIVFEICASLFEYTFLQSTQNAINKIPSGISTELIIGSIFTLFLWLCVYNFIFWKKTNLLLLLIFAFTGLYLVITKDVSFQFLLHNLEPIHFFQASFSIALILELFLKLILLYLVFKVIKIYKQNKKLESQT